MKTFREFLEEVYLIEYSRNKSRPLQRPYNPEEDEEIERHADENSLSTNERQKLLHQARTKPIRKIDSSKLDADNTDVTDLKPGAQGRRNLRRALRSYGRNPDERIKRILRQRREGTLEPAVIHQDKEGKKTVVSGNTRLSAGKVYRFKVPTKTIGDS